MKMSSKTYSREILNKITEKSRIILSQREKNLKFIKKYNFSSSEINSYIRNLNEQNFKEKVKNKDKKIDAEYLYIFNINMSLEDEYGDINFVPIYIKICQIKKDKEYIFIVSFHEDE